MYYQWRTGRYCQSAMSAICCTEAIASYSGMDVKRAHSSHHSARARPATEPCSASTSILRKHAFVYSHNTPRHVGPAAFSSSSTFGLSRQPEFRHPIYSLDYTHSQWRSGDRPTSNKKTPEVTFFTLTAASLVPRPVPMTNKCRNRVLGSMAPTTTTPVMLIAAKMQAFLNNSQRSVLVTQTLSLVNIRLAVAPSRTAAPRAHTRTHSGRLTKELCGR